VILEPLLLTATRLLVGGQAYWLGTRPSPRQRIYFANHASNMDTVVLWAALPPELRRAPTRSPPRTTG
jgi:1-acyl-sn-glycerol-3-phosphate acyltransferase